MYRIFISLARNSNPFRGPECFDVEHKQVNYKTNHYIDENYLVYRLNESPAGVLR